MLFKKCLMCILFIFIMQTKCDEKCKQDPTKDEQIKIDPSITEPGICYYFAYDNNMDPAVMKATFPSGFHLYNGIARLSGYSLDFDRIGPKPVDIFSTLIPDNAGYTYGLVYSVTVQDLAAYRDVINSYERKNLLKCEAFTVEVDKDGCKTSVISNTLVLVNNPPKENPIPENRRPSYGYLKDIITGLKLAHVEKVDKNYIHKIASIPVQKKDDKKNC